jgi:flagellar biosynthesis GTPase FlhF
MRAQLKHVSIRSFKRRTASPNAQVMINGCEKPIGVKLRLVKLSELNIPAECNYLRKTAEVLPFDNANNSNLRSNVVESNITSVDTLNRERVERERAERERLSAERAERARLERERLERERSERIARERTEREEAEAARLAAESAEAERLAAIEAERISTEEAKMADMERSYFPSDIYIPTPKRKDCMVYKNSKGNYKVYLFNLKVRNLRAYSAKRANWYIVGMDNYIPLHLAHRGMSSMYISNKSVNLGKSFVPYLEIIPIQDGVRAKYVPLYKCQGFDEFENL